MNYTFRMFIEILNNKQSIVEGSNGKKYMHVDIHVGNLTYEMEKSLTPDQLDEFIKILVEYSTKKRIKMDSLKKTI